MKGMILCGIDVSARTLDVAIDVGRGPVWTGVFDDTEPGHRELVLRLGARRRRVRVVVEATGVYHLDLALALQRSKSIEVMVSVMRKLLHAIHGVFEHDQDFDGEKFFATRT